MGEIRNAYKLCFESLEPGWETLSPNSSHHVKTKKLGCSIENLKKILKIHCLNKLFQNMQIFTTQVQLPLDANN
jgi:hypothetical protein